MKWWRLRTVDARVVDKEMAKEMAENMDNLDADPWNNNLRFNINKALATFKDNQGWNNRVKGLQILKSIMSKPNGAIPNGT